MHKKISCSGAPEAIGPYSQGIITKSLGSLIFVSGQLPIDPVTGKLIQGDMQALTRQVLLNIKAILEESGATFQHVVKTEVFMIDLKEFANFNEEYKRHFPGPVYPARQTIQVAALPLGAALEISCIAVI